MGRADPFFGYSLILRTILFALIPAFTAWQFVRLRRALQIFQLESYKRRNFMAWSRANRSRALFLTRIRAKKPLVMTGRAWRLLVVATALSLLGVIAPSAVAHLWLGGAPADLIAWAVSSVAMFLLAPSLLVAADWLLTPVQAAINLRYLRAARRKLDSVRPRVIGITGSFGKTSTKFAIGALLGPPDEVLVTPGSFNTTMGVCRTINENLLPGHKFFVVEMGARQEGDVSEIGRFVRHSIAVLTAIGPAHLSSFGSMEAVRRGKYEIVTTLPRDGIAVMNVDDVEVRQLADATQAVRVVRYGLEEAGRPDVTATDVEVGRRGTKLTVVDRLRGDTVGVSTRLLGRHSVGHILAAAAVALETGGSLGELRGPIESLRPVEHRLQIIDGTGGVTVIDDAFNSNPEGAAAALEVLAAMPGRRKVVVTPGIIELGELQYQANEDFAREAARVADTVVFVAKVNRAPLLAGATGVAGGAQIVTVDSLDEASARLRGLLGAGDVVLFENDLPDQYEG